MRVLYSNSFLHPRRFPWEKIVFLEDVHSYYYQTCEELFMGRIDHVGGRKRKGRSSKIKMIKLDAQAA